MASKMVMAIGDSGYAELAPVDDVVEIPVLQFAIHPVTVRNVAVPVTIRALHHAFGQPVRLTGISTKNQPWPYIRWKDNRGNPGSCFVRNSHEAIDPLFSLLPARSRERIVRSIEGSGR